jgi:hypothetical protein
MTTRITIDSDETTTTFHVTDDGGRDQTATMPRYPRLGSEQHCEIINKLDVLMWQWENRRGERQGSPVMPDEYCYTRADD